MQSFIFGGNTGLSYDQLKSRQRHGEMLMRRAMARQPKTVMQGVNGAAENILGALMMKRASEGMDAGRNAFNDRYAEVMEANGMPHDPQLTELAQSPYANAGQRSALAELIANGGKFPTGTTTEHDPMHSRRREINDLASDQRRMYQQRLQGACQKMKQCSRKAMTRTRC